MAAVSLIDVSKAYETVGAVEHVGFALETGRFLTLLGPSGCGKSTTLRLIAGLVAPDSGDIVIDGATMTAVPTHQRRIGMVFQNLALFPHMTVAENVAFGLRMRQVERAERTRRVGEALDMVKLTGFEARLPKQLSGGQQQRVALARALITRPTVLLLDEPFAALDRKLRLEMQGELRALIRQTGTTTIFVTHDQEEALVLSDVIAVMNRGRVEQIDQPAAVFERPVNAFVADFMGATNLFAGRVESAIPDGARIALDDVALTVVASTARDAGQEVAVAIRPDAITLDRTGAADGVNAVEGTISAVIYQGTHATYTLRVAARTEVRLVARVPLAPGGGGVPLREGDRVQARWTAAAVHVMAR